MTSENLKELVVSWSPLGARLPLSTAMCESSCQSADGPLFSLLLDCRLVSVAGALPSSDLLSAGSRLTAGATHSAELIDITLGGRDLPASYTAVSVTNSLCSVSVHLFAV